MRHSRLKIAAVALCTVACSTSGPPASRTLDLDGRFSVPESIASGAPVRVDFNWQPRAGFVPPDRETFVYVHLFDADGEMVVQDDHSPEVPPREWRPGEAQRYTRWLYPLEPLDGPWIDVYVGLYDGAGKWWYRRDGEWVEHPRIRRLRIRRDDRSGLPRYGEGWHPELTGWRGEGRARWTEGAAVATFSRPRGRAVLHFRANSASGWIRGPQQVRLLIDGRPLRTVIASDFEPITIRHELSPSERRVDERIRLEIRASPVVERTLAGTRPPETYGIQVTHLYLQSDPMDPPGEGVAGWESGVGSDGDSGG